MTETKLGTLPETDRTLGERAQAAASSAKDKVSSAATTTRDAVSSAASSTIEAAKEHPYAAAGIAAGVAAAVAGGAYAATKLREDAPKPKK